jgi:hypothetical protein
MASPWESFVRGIVAREHMPSWERLWDDFVQEELRLAQDLLVSSVVGMMVGILLFWQRARRRPRRVPRVGPSNNRERR